MGVRAPILFLLTTRGPNCLKRRAKRWLNLVGQRPKPYVAKDLALAQMQVSNLCLARLWPNLAGLARL